MYSPSPVDKAQLLKELIASHTHIVTVALETFPADERRDEIITQTLHDYTEMFFDKVHAIIKDL